MKIIYGVKVKLKSESTLLKLIGFIIKPFNPHFMSSYWTTIFTTVYAPSSFNINDEDVFIDHKIVLEHEKIHIEDFKKYHIWYLFSYCLPYFRFIWERRAYILELQQLCNNNEYDLFYWRLDRIVNALGGSEYFWSWHKPWIRKWFLKKLNMWDNEKL